MKGPEQVHSKVVRPVAGVGPDERSHCPFASIVHQDVGRTQVGPCRSDSVGEVFGGSQIGKDGPEPVGGRAGTLLQSREPVRVAVEGDHRGTLGLQLQGDLLPHTPGPLRSRRPPAR